jgi:hypothetical protein
LKQVTGVEQDDPSAVQRALVADELNVGRQGRETSDVSVEIIRRDE